MRLIKLALALVAVSSNWAALASPAINSSVSGSIAGTVGATAVSATAAAPGSHLGADLRSNLRSNLTSNLGHNLSGSDNRAHAGSSQAGAMDESIPRGWLMALVAVLLIGHQLRRKHRFLRPHRFSDF